MREVDLIPASYRRQRRQQLWLKAAVGTLLGLTVSTGLARVWIDAAVDDVNAEVARLEIQQTVTAAESDRLAALNLDRQSYDEQLYLLKGLRSGAPATELFGIVEQALIGEEVWFRSWNFRRAGVTDPQGQVLESGYFLIVPQSSGQQDTWRVETNMTISGQAIDHAALSQFVQRLLANPEIENVHVRNTDLQRYGTRSLVDFDLAVIVNREAMH
jgi:phosphoribosylformylglycinamidine (FGAM) synthase PurS component